MLVAVKMGCGDDEDDPMSFGLPERCGMAMFFEGDKAHEVADRAMNSKESRKLRMRESVIIYDFDVCVCRQVYSIVSFCTLF